MLLLLAKIMLLLLLFLLRAISRVRSHRGAGVFLLSASALGRECRRRCGCLCPAHILAVAVITVAVVAVAAGRADAVAAGCADLQA